MFTPLEQGLPSPPILFFNCPIRDIIPTITRKPTNADNNDDHYEAIIARQNKAGTLKEYTLFP